MITPKHLYLVVATILVWATALFSAYSWTTQPQEDTAILDHRTLLLRSATSEVHAKMSANEYQFSQQLSKIGWQDNLQLVDPLRKAAQERQRFNSAYGEMVRQVPAQAYDPTAAAQVLAEVAFFKDASLRQIESEFFTHITTFRANYDLSAEDVVRWQRSVKRKVADLATPNELLSPPATWKQFQERAVQIHGTYLLACLDYQEAIITQLELGVVGDVTR